MSTKNKAEQQTARGNARGIKIKNAAAKCAAPEYIERFTLENSLGDMVEYCARDKNITGAFVKIGNWTFSCERAKLTAAQKTIAAVIANCDFAIANGDKSMREFAAAIKRIASQEAR